MKLLVLGSGGREHAIIWKLRQSPEVKEIYCSPGNGGISQIATLVPACAESDWNSYTDFVKSKKIDFTIVGPEVPLCAGIVDRFREKNLKIFGPDKICAQLEGSKIFAKNFMRKCGIPTANFKVLDNPKEAVNFLTHLDLTTYRYPLVIKADGLAQGKGVFICSNQVESQVVLEKIMVQKIFGNAGEKILIEETLIGKEVSLIAFCDGKSLKCLPPARDYKRIWDDNRGPNTGGMGAVAPVEIDPTVFKKIERSIFQPFLKGLQNEGLDYRGIIYFGLMLTKEGPFVLEFNVRFGDPETQVVLPLLETDLLKLIVATSEQKLEKTDFKISNEVCMSVVCASRGYPEKVETGYEISGLDHLTGDKNTFLLHAGTVAQNGKFYTSGGRVLNIVSRGKDLEEARTNCYASVSHIRFDGMQFRKDIAQSLS